MAMKTVGSIYLFIYFIFRKDNQKRVGWFSLEKGLMIALQNKINSQSIREGSNNSVS